MKTRRTPWILFALGLALALLPQPVFACAACFGKSDSALAQGMNMGIFSLLGVIVFVLGAFATFFIYLAKKSSAVAAHSMASEPAETPNKS